MQILGVDKASITNDAGSGFEGNGGINTFSVLGAKGGSDTNADSLLTDGTTLTAEWVDTTGEDSYEVSILDSSGTATVCGPVVLPADSTSHSFTGCSLSHATTYRIQVLAKNSTHELSQLAETSFHVGPFISVGNMLVVERGIVTVPVTLSYPVSSPVTVQYLTADGTALGGSDYSHISSTTLTIPAGQTSANLSVSMLKDYIPESSETLRLEFSSAAGATVLTPSVTLTIQDDDPSPATGFSQIDSSAQHTCGVMTNGAAKCWGSNVSGQAGDNSINTAGLPTQVLGLSSGISQVSAGGLHSCALTTSGAVKCWGYNSGGQLGNNTITDSLVPVDVLNVPPGVTQIDTGGGFSCALTSSGAVYCWGGNLQGQLGDNTTTQKLIPNPVTDLSSGVGQFSSGNSHSCALTTLGAVKCWGYNTNGQIGDNSTSNRLTPVDVFGLSSGITQLAAGGNHTCALTAAGAVQCWGSNSSGQLGDNTITQKLVPTNVIGLSSGIVQIAAGNSHSCALNSTGGMSCWGQNSFGLLGDGSTSIYSMLPVTVSGLSSSVVQMAAGQYHTCALLSTGLVQCWGYSVSTGDASTSSRREIGEVFGLSTGLLQIAGGGQHSCAITSPGALKCWGTNSNGQVGNNTTQVQPIPVNVTGLSSGVASVSAGQSHSCAIDSASGIQCWGVNTWGQLGDNTTTQKSVPTPVFGLSSGMSQVAAGNIHTCAVSALGTALCWGRNNFGQLGDNTVGSKWAPIAVNGLTSGASQIGAGDGFSCVLTTAGAVKCWGRNNLGQLGDNTNSSRLIPTNVSGLQSGFTQIAVGASHACALDSAGLVKCWGNNASGQIGDNTFTDRILPTGPLGLPSGITQIAAGGTHTCALTSGGSVYCWGNNTAGQVGGQETNLPVPTAMPELGSGVVQISLGFFHSCARTWTGAGKCWGDSSSGLLGEEYSNSTPHYVGLGF